MAVDNSIRTIDGLKDTDKPWQSYRDIDATQETFANYYAGGTPNWMKWPQEYKNFAAEEYQRELEKSKAMALDYKIEEQEKLTNRAARMVNPMSTRDFVLKLRTNGIKCFTVDNGFPKGTVALWCMPPNQNRRARYICYLQVPAMYEWSVLREDRHGKPDGEDFRGWRVAVAQLIEKEILTETHAHEIFGKPSQNPIFSRYHQTLWEYRNGKKYTESKLHDNDV
jgi:hypothetical protein